MAAKKFRTFEEMWEFAHKMTGEMMEACVSGIDWDAFERGQASIADIVEKRYIGLDDQMGGLLHRLAVAGERLEHVEDSPRKRAAQALTADYGYLFEEYLDKKAEAMVFAQIGSFLYDKNYIIPDAVRKEAMDKSRQNAGGLAGMSGQMKVYDRLFSSFFKSASIPDSVLEGEETEAEKQIFARLNRVLPEGEEYAPFRSMDGYVRQQAPLRPLPDSAVLMANPDAVTGITMNNAVPRLRAANPKKADREWAAGTFDRMIEGLYTEDDLEGIKNSGKMMFDTVFLDGKSAGELFKPRPGEQAKDYEDRVKCEVVAYALEGKGKVDICPYEWQGNGYTMKDPVPMKVKVNLKEELSVWKRAMRFFHIKSETKKEKAERVSVENLREEERLGAVREEVEKIRKRERERQMAQDAKQKYWEDVEREDVAYFGFMGGSEEEITDAMSNETRAKVGNETAELVRAMPRLPSRMCLVRLFALTKGMTVEQVFSDDPGLLERKRQIGQEMMDIIGFADKAKYEETHGPDANDTAYLQEKRERAFQMVRDIHQHVISMPFEPIADMNAETLIADYQKNTLLGRGMIDIEQGFSPLAGVMGREEEFRRIADDIMAIGERNYTSAYVDYVATDAYVMPHFTKEEDMDKVAKGMAAAAGLDAYRQNTEGCKTLGDVSGRITMQDIGGQNMVKRQIQQFLEAPEHFYDGIHYLATGKDPIWLYNKEERNFSIGSSKEIREQAKRRQDILSASRESGKVKVGLETLEDKAEKTRKAPSEGHAKKEQEKILAKEEFKKGAKVKAGPHK